MFPGLKDMPSTPFPYKTGSILCLVKIFTKDYEYLNCFSRKKRIKTSKSFILLFKGYPLRNKFNVMLLQFIDAGLIDFWARSLAEKENAISAVGHCCNFKMCVDDKY